MGGGSCLLSKQLKTLPLVRERAGARNGPGGGGRFLSPLRNILWDAQVMP